MNSEVASRPRVLAELAGLRLPTEREAVVTAMFEGSTRTIAGALAQQEYSEIEPATRFRPPASRPA